ncbi:hypothetical protein [Aromatoleum buckelii]|uniref:hypothetical protein n=1 Tax=Aromatoleum buckelii TaxID=200254 RepID=UPI001FF55548|nr:hypothetical protein [Aromatoleum buckelii]MCK0510874.1 hypothetical protein [Aromatoleum buckelii]
MLAQRLTPLLLLVALGGCEQIGILLELPDPKKEAAVAEAEGKAIGGACRHSGRSLEDCYLLNAKAQKAAVFAGWREMNDYMMQNNMQSIPSQLSQPNAPSALSSGAAGAKEIDETATPAAADGERRPRRAPTTS